MKKHIKNILIKIILYLDRREKAAQVRKIKSAAKRKHKKRYRWKYKNQALVLLLFLLVLLLAIMLISKGKSNSSENDQKDVRQVMILQTIQDMVTKEAETAIEGNSNPYKRLYYYDPSRLKRYKVYQAFFPDMKTGDVVWRVNVNLDRKHYKYWEPVKDRNSTEVLISKTFFIGKSFQPLRLRQLQDGVLVRDVVVKPFEQLKKAAADEGHKIYAKSGYRSYDAQKEQFLSYFRTDGAKADKYSARPGFSEHQSGLAIDVNSVGQTELTDFAGTADAKWLKNNAYKYGFIVRYTEENKSITGYTAEAWHIRYVGKKHSYNMHRLHISSYEEYKVKYIDYSNDDKVSQAKKSYMVARKRE